MADRIFRYREIGVDIDKVNFVLPPAFPATIEETSGNAQIDIQADDSVKSDLDVAMMNYGFEYVETDPANTINPDSLLAGQTVGVGPAILLQEDGTEFVAVDGMGYIFEAKLIGARIDAADVSISAFVILNAHSTGGVLVLDSTNLLSGSAGVLAFSTPSGLTLRASVSGVAGKTYNWSMLLRMTAASGFP